jgi:hypothetical protein
MHFPASSLGMENIEKPTKLKKLKNWINWKIKKLINLKHLNRDKKILIIIFLKKFGLISVL